MTFTEIVQDVAGDLDLTSQSALARIGRNVNKRYRWLASSMGFDTIGRATVTANTVGDSATRTVTFSQAEKVLDVRNPAFPNNPPLDEVLYDELLNTVPGTDPAQAFAIYKMGASSVTIFLDVAPASIYALTADVLQNQPTLSGAMIPAFAEDFHDILTYGPKAIELKKKGRAQEAEIEEAMFDKRMGELRLYQAKSAYLAIYQGKMGSDTLPIVPPLVV